MKLKQFKREWEGIDKIKIFELQVVDIRTGEKDYIIFHISISKKSLVAQHIALTKKQDNSKKIAFVSVVLDLDFNIDANLETLYYSCIDAINESDYFLLSE